MRSRPPLAGGLAVLWLSIIVLLPLAAVVDKSLEGGLSSFWQAVSAPQARAALELTLGVSLVVTAINAVMGTVIAWVLVRDEFRGKAFVNSLIDLPFALPTIVAGLTLLALYGPRSPLHVNVAIHALGVAFALLFVTLPFVVRAVQPVLLDLDREAEEAAASLGASPFTIFRKRGAAEPCAARSQPGAGLGFARALGEFGAVVLISGNLPFQDRGGVRVRLRTARERQRAEARRRCPWCYFLMSFVLLLALSAFARGRRW